MAKPFQGKHRVEDACGTTAAFRNRKEKRRKRAKAAKQARKRNRGK